MTKEQVKKLKIERAQIEAELIALSSNLERLEHTNREWSITIRGLRRARKLLSTRHDEIRALLR